MKNLKITTIDRIIAEFDPVIDNPPQIVNNFRQKTHVWVVPAKVTVEFRRNSSKGIGAEHAFAGVTVQGQQYQMFASGEVKKRGPGRGPEFEPTEWAWPTWVSMPSELQRLVRELYQWIPIDVRGEK